MSAGLINRLKWGDGIRVNDVPCFTNHPVLSGDRITVRLDEPEIAYPAEDGHLNILYEDADLLAVDKPAGILVHPSRSQFTGTLANLVAGYYRRTGQKSAFHPVTRLDRDTFGVVLLAKHAHAHQLLQSGKLQKTYHALTYGGPSQENGLIDAPIARRPLPSLLRFIHPDGKPSVTEYRVLERQGELCKLELHPVTGRTHQLRLHCLHMGFPILGDPQYHTEASAACSHNLGLSHQILCAKRLEFLHPLTDVPLDIQSQLEAECPPVNSAR
jgi:23S rRNA pseudouridine1911/1915/1917 synthase